MQLPQLMKNEMALYAHTTTASPCSQGGQWDDEGHGRADTTAAPPTVRRPQQLGEGEDEDSHHHWTPDHHCEQLFMGWKQGTGRPGTIGRCSGQQFQCTQDDGMIFSLAFCVGAEIIIIFILIIFFLPCPLVLMWG